MQISYVRIENFRNFKLCAVELGRNIVLAGENRSGKSNFVHALRLILDPSLSNEERYLTDHDFWDGDRPFGGREIKVVIRFTDFADNNTPDLLALTWLSNCLISKQPPEAQLTYIYYNDKKPASPVDSTYEDYEFKIYPGNDSTQDFRPKIREMRESIPLHLIVALRDIASDSQSWRRSPLRKLIELSDLKQEELEPFAKRIQEVNEDISKLAPIARLEKDIQSRFVEMVGTIRSSVPSLSLSATTVTELIRALTLRMDGDKYRDIERISLGLQNALYLTLLSLLLDKQQVKRTKQRHQFMPIVALEEPEAHLHPHLQRVIFHDFLEQALKRRLPVLISTHSPHIVSVSKLEDIVLFKDKGDRGSEARSTLSFINTLTIREKKDLERFLDITKAEMLFSKGVIFVEGDVEALLISEFANILNTSLDKHGISICNVTGVHFSHVVTLAHKFDIPFVVLTDGDKSAPITGIHRAISLLEIVNPVRYRRLSLLYQNQRSKRLQKYLEQEGIFVNAWTFEVSLLQANNYDIFKDVFLELGSEIGVSVQAGIKYINQYLQNPSDEILKQILNSIADPRWSKGRFAHRLLKHIRSKAESLDTWDAKTAIIPDYIQGAINYLLKRVNS